MSTASTGLLAYVQGSFGHRQLVWTNRSGTIVGTVGPPDDASLANPELSPDGRRVAVTRLTQGPTVWLIDVARGVPIRFTSSEGNHTGPLWSPDGQRVLFRRVRAGTQDLFVKPLDGLRDAHVVNVTGSVKTPTGWSPDGRVLLYAVPGDDLMGFDFETKRTLEVGVAVPLFRANLVPAGANGVLTLDSGAKQQYAVAADGRFLMNVPVADAATPQPSPSSSTGQDC